MRLEGGRGDSNRFDLSGGPEGIPAAEGRRPSGAGFFNRAREGSGRFFFYGTGIWPVRLGSYMDPQTKVGCGPMSVGDMSDLVG